MGAQADKQVPWEVVNTNQGYAIRGDCKASNGAVIQRYIAQLIPDKRTAKLMACAKKMKTLLEDVTQYLADGPTGEESGCQDIKGQRLYREICKLLRGLRK